MALPRSSDGMRKGPECSASIATGLLIPTDGLLVADLGVTCPAWWQDAYRRRRHESQAHRPRGRSQQPKPGWPLRRSPGPVRRAARKNLASRFHGCSPRGVSGSMSPASSSSLINDGEPWGPVPTSKTLCRREACRRCAWAKGSRDRRPASRLPPAEVGIGGWRRRDRRK